MSETSHGNPSAPRGKEEEIVGRIATATRTDSPERWRVTLDVTGANADALAGLRGVVYN